MTDIETDDLIIGAGATGLAFADSLLEASEFEIVLVDRRNSPGGHWNDAYSFVRLHQPSAYYGVTSRKLGEDRIDETGLNSGLYEHATGAAICDNFVQVLDGMQASGRVKFFPMNDYIGDWSTDHRFVSRLTGESTTVRVQKRIVDATYLETAIPKTHQRPFSVAEGVTCIPINDLVEPSEPTSGYTVIGAGKTAMDACSWLLQSGVSPMIRWVRPRDAWLLNRDYQQPQDLVGQMMDGYSRTIEAVAKAEDRADLLRRLEESGQLLRVDPHVEPTMYRCATFDSRELEAPHH